MCRTLFSNRSSVESNYREAGRFSCLASNAAAAVAAAFPCCCCRAHRVSGFLASTKYRHNVGEIKTKKFIF